MTRTETQGRQTQLYGAPLASLVGRITETLALSQAAVARTLGVSAPMLSQLVTGQRVKFGNPQAHQRLESMLDLSDEVIAGLPFQQVSERLDAIRDDTSSTLSRRREPAIGEIAAPRAVAAVLRAVASGRELASAADLLEAQHPGLAEVLRVYGLADEQAARAHHARIID